MKYALISDFDGTISFDDFFYYAAESIINKSALGPWQEYMSGKKTHFLALKEIFESIHISKEELDKFIKTIKIDNHFYKTFDLCKQKNIPVYIVSAGCDYYIKIILGDLLKEITLITNSATYDQKSGLIMSPQPKDSPYYSLEVGVDKKAVVKKLIDDGYFTIFAGDGKPDVEPAKIADVVFARKHLLEKCIELNIKTQKFDSYENIYDYIKELKGGN